MDYINEFVDERQNGWCIHCGRTIAQLESNRDHVPSKSLLQKPYPDNLPVVDICRKCNSDFSPDEEYVAAFLGALLSGTTDPNQQTNPTVSRILKRQHKLRALIQRAKREYRTIDGQLHSVWKPDIARITKVVIKNARGHAFYESGEPMLSEPNHIAVVPIAALTSDERTQFESIDVNAGWSEIGSRMLTRALTDQDVEDGWVIVQRGIYRYAVAQNGHILVRIVIAEYLAAEIHWNE
jgi:hypothetical protein